MSEPTANLAERLRALNLNAGNQNAPEPGLAISTLTNTPSQTAGNSAPVGSSTSSNPYTSSSETKVKGELSSNASGLPYMYTQRGCHSSERKKSKLFKDFFFCEWQKNKLFRITWAAYHYI